MLRCIIFAINFKREVTLVRAFKLAFVSLVLLAFCACSTLVDVVERNEGAANLVTQYATLRAIESTKYPNLSAAKIVEVATGIRDSVDNGEVILVTHITDRLDREVPWDKLAPSDALVVTALIRTIEGELSARITSGVIDREARVVVKAIAQAVIDAAMLSL